VIHDPRRSRIPCLSARPSRSSQHNFRWTMHRNELAAATREVVELIQLVVHGLVVVTTAPCAAACVQIGSIWKLLK